MPLSKESFYLFLIWHRTEDEPAGLSECANQLLSLSFSSTFWERISKNSYSISRSVLFRHVPHKVTYCGAFLEEKFVTFWYTFGDCHFLVYFWWVWQIYTSNTGNKLTKETTQPRQHPGLSYWVNSVFANFDSLNQCNEIGILGPKVHCFQSQNKYWQVSAVQYTRLT